MDTRKIIILAVLLMAVVGLTVGSTFALNVPIKYKTKIFTNYYYKTDKIHGDIKGQYFWIPKNAHFSDSVITEQYGGSKTKITYYIYNNNGKYKWVDVRSSKLTVKYKIKTSTKTYYKTKIIKYTKIPKYGLTKTLTLKGPKGSKVSIYYIKWTQVQRLWYGQ
ncbi:MAG: hypothetical protein Q7U35_03345 [Methanobacteriaceae archaeon]|nr:hypothetical protein [Methanobacteriaceae archaeon]MDP2835829.1 hypothetical protein [Methanobacteriaceae archaeon]MDP3034632.1 hypothetical protein [Methanobacteriaceae archaeon]MDP3623287.1 hypothetical protein [Methanobacteriaceae archaeon]